ncbi:class E sortase [Streptomyces sp. NPDC002889]|uniref:class E sortase n=1 Tax=Streptomyces sp. NPDC002889 TaxID=3364669 RepID=UPI003677714E
MRELRVVVQGRRGRVAVARGLWAAAEVAVTLGVVVLLLVVHQLWWTNRQAREDARRQVQVLEREWERDRGRETVGDTGAGRGTGAGDGKGQREGGRQGEQQAGGGNGRPSPRRWDHAYAVLRIPRLGVTAPVAQGIGKRGVLDKGYVGHYPQTAQPGQAGNFAVAGHRNTHGEPFRYIDRLRGGDRIEVATRDAVFVYAVDTALPRTTPRDTGVIAPVPRSLVKPAAGYGERGYYLTLTTCTPEYSSRYRLVVWGKLVSMRPR